MAWATKKQFVILNNNDKGKKIAKNLPNLKQDEFERQFSQFLKSGNTKQTDEKQDDNTVKPKETANKPKKDDNKKTNLEGSIDKKALKATIDEMIAKYQTESANDPNQKDRNTGAVDGLKQLSSRLGLGSN